MLNAAADGVISCWSKPQYHTTSNEEYCFLGIGQIVSLTQLAHWLLDSETCISCLDYTQTPGRALIGLENGNQSLSWEDLLSGPQVEHRARGTLSNTG